MKFFTILSLGLIFSGVTQAADPALLGHWKYVGNECLSGAAPVANQAEMAQFMTLNATLDFSPTEVVTQVGITIKADTATVKQSMQQAQMYLAKLQSMPSTVETRKAIADLKDAILKLNMMMNGVHCAANTKTTYTTANVGGVNSMTTPPSSGSISCTPAGFMNPSISAKQGKTEVATYQLVGNKLKFSGPEMTQTASQNKTTCAAHDDVMVFSR